MGADYDLIVLGGGSAGFAAAIRSAELGARTALVNAGQIGGTCVNVGCVPSKTLIRAAAALHSAQGSRFAGIESGARVADFAAVIRQKDELTAGLRKAKYIDVLSSYAEIELIEGRGVFRTPHAVEVDGRVVRAPRIVVATGSLPRIAPIAGLAEARPLTSTTLFESRTLPRSLIVLGGRYVALECAQMMARMGSRVTILQRSDHLLPTEDDDLTEALADFLREEGIRVETGVTVDAVGTGGGKVRVSARVRGSAGEFEADKLLCATGRRPVTAGFGLREVGVNLGKNAAVQVDEYLRTSADGIYAAGDVIGEPAFVYTAAYEGGLAAENALGSEPRPRDYAALPWVIFTDPQVAGVGMNEKEAALAGLEVDVARLDLEHVPRALAARDTRGFFKLLRERGSDRLVGARILAPEGGEQVMEAVLAIRNGITVSRLVDTFHPYLTQSEGMRICAQAFDKDVGRLSCCSA